MRKTFHFVFFLFLLVMQCTMLFAGETGKISGRVMDKESSTALAGVNIVITSRWDDGVEKPIKHAQGAASDIQGDYFILNVSPGTYSLRASYVGYKQEIITQIVVNVDKTTSVDFALISSAIQGGEVVVTAYKPNKIEADLTATKQVYNIEAIQGSPGVSSLSDILELQADVVDDHFRGGRVGQSSYLIGGVSISNPLSNTRSFSPMITGMQQVEVYTSGFSAEYGNAQSGVVNMIAREGGDSWQTRLETSGTIPGNKTFGGSVYDPTNLPFVDLLNHDPHEWSRYDPNQGRALWQNASSYPGNYSKAGDFLDTLSLMRLTQITWLQTIRKLGLKYNDRLDYRLDFSIGGPLAEGIKMFIAARQNIVNPLIPTANPDLEDQIMSNISFQPNQDDKIKFSFTYDLITKNVLDGGWYDWMFQPTLSVTQNVQSTNLYSIEWKHVFTPALFTEFTLSYLNIRTDNFIEVINPGQYSDDYTRVVSNLWPDYTGASSHTTDKLQSSRGVQKLGTYDLHYNFNYQMNKNNLLKAGLQFQYYNLNVDQQQSISNSSSIQKIKFQNFPYEGALYLQDKMEFDGFIANLGLRYDFYNMNTRYYSDLYSPLRNPLHASDTTLPYYDQNLALKTKSTLYSKLQPRIGFSFPLSESTVFHLNYGTFTQRPSFTQIYYNQVSANNDIQFIGNPRLQPENTRAYDIGVVNTPVSGYRFEVSAYYKDVTNLVEISNFEDSYPKTYKTYTNREYADVKGAIINFDKTEGNIRGYVRYNYESAKGKNSNDLKTPVTYSEIAANIKMTAPEDVYLDYDRSHKLVSNLEYVFGNDEGFRIGGVYPLENMTFNCTFRLYSGRPYTWDPTGSGLQYNERTPVESELRMRIEKTVKTGKALTTFYIEGFNLLNSIVYNYSAVFSNPTTDVNLTKYQSDPGNVRLYDEWKPYTTDQSIYVISNSPRYFRFGVIVKF